MPLESKKDLKKDLKKELIDEIIGGGESDDEDTDVETDEEPVVIEEEVDETDKLDNNDYGDDDVVVNDNDNDNDGNDIDETCINKFSNKKKDDDEEDDDIPEEMTFEDDNIQSSTIISDPMLRQAKPILTKYERVRALGARTIQLSMGAKPMLLNVEHLTSRQIAKMELEQKVMPFIVEKPMPSGDREHWYINELKILN